MSQPIHGPAHLSLAEAFARPEYATTKRLYDYWQSRRAGDAWPRRADLDPVIDIPEVTPYLTLLDVHYGADGRPENFRFRLVGTAIVDFEGDCTGKWLSDVLPEAEDRDAPAWAQYRDACGGDLWVRIFTLAWQGREAIAYSSLLLPVAMEGTRADLLLGCHYGEKADRAPSPSP